MPPDAPLAPGRVPFFGHTLRLKRDPLEFMVSLRSCGDQARILIGSRQVHVLNSVDLIRAVTVTEAGKFDKGAMFDELRNHLGNGLVTSSGDLHRRQRRLVQPAFHAARIIGYGELMAGRAAAWVDGWQPGDRLELTAEIDRLTLDILLGTLFGTGPAPHVRQGIERWLTIKQGSMKRALSPFPRLLQRKQVDDAALAELRSLLTGVLRDGGHDGGMLAMLAQTGRSEAELCDELVTLFVAGTGTVSAALAWSFHELGRHPEVERRLQDEVDHVLAGRNVTVHDVGVLPYTRRVVKEILRLHPVWLLMRRATAPVELGGVELRPGAEVFFSPYALHRDPSLYVEPDRFDPDRWHEDVPRGAFIPFGAGNRLCVGEGFAWTELIIVVAAVAACWRLRPAPDHEVRSRVGTVERPDRLPMIVEAR